MQKRLVRSVDKFIASTTNVSNVGPVICQNVIPTTPVLQKLTNQDKALTDDLN